MDGRPPIPLQEEPFRCFQVPTVYYVMKGSEKPFANFNWGITTQLTIIYAKVSIVASHKTFAISAVEPTTSSI